MKMLKQKMKSVRSQSERRTENRRARKREPDKRRTAAIVAQRGGAQLTAAGTGEIGLLLDRFFSTTQQSGITVYLLSTQYCDMSYSY